MRVDPSAGIVVVVAIAHAATEARMLAMKMLLLLVSFMLLISDGLI